MQINNNDFIRIGRGAMVFMNFKLKTAIRNISNKSTIMSHIYSKMNKIKVKYYSTLGDYEYAKMKYKENTGKELNLENPTTFNEKIWWLKLNNKDPLMTICSDKLKVRDYVETNGLKEILNPLLGSYDKAEDINFDKLPKKAFIKTNNASGTNFLWDRSKVKKFNRNKFNKWINNSLNSNYFLQSREYNYKNIHPKILIEHYIEDNSETGLVDYRFLCFNGKVKLLFVDIDVASDDGKHNPLSKRNVYDKNFVLQKHVKAKRENFDPFLVDKPKNFERMVRYAEKLAEPFEFCRVDFYNVRGKIIFGEITFYPGGGTQIVTPKYWENQLGNWIDLHSSKIIKER